MGVNDYAYWKNERAKERSEGVRLNRTAYWLSDRLGKFPYALGCTGGFGRPDVQLFENISSVMMFSEAHLSHSRREKQVSIRLCDYRTSSGAWAYQLEARGAWREFFPLSMSQHDPRVTARNCVPGVIVLFEASYSERYGAVISSTSWPANTRTAVTRLHGLPAAYSATRGRNSVVPSAPLWRLTTAPTEYSTTKLWMRPGVAIGLPLASVVYAPQGTAELPAGWRFTTSVHEACAESYEAACRAAEQYVAKTEKRT